MSLRAAQASDGAFFLRVRNEPGVRRASWTERRIGREEHGRWFREALGRDDRDLYLILDGARPVGTGRLDFAGEMAEVGVALLPEARGRGYGQAAIRLLCRAATERARWILARVRRGNLRSVMAFTGAGFQAVGQDRKGWELWRRA